MNQPNSTPTSSYAYIDRLRVLASVAVILIHVTLGSLDTLTPFGLCWWIGHWICLVNQWAVPIFVMISGALLLNPEHRVNTPMHFYKKRFQKIGWPLLFWTSVYFGIRKVLDHEPVTAGYILDHLAKADPPYHTYFLFLMVGLYLVTPVLRLFVQHTSSPQRRGLILILFILSSGYALANAWFWSNERFLLSFFVPYLGYYLCGYELTQLSDSTLTKRHWAWAIGLSLLYIVLIAFPYTDSLGRQNGRFVLGYFSVPVIVMSVAIFRAAWQQDRQTGKQSNRRVEKLTHRIAPATFGIYLIHLAVLVGLREATSGHSTSSHFLVNVVPGTIIAFGLSYAITWVLQKTPGLKRLV